MKKYRLLHKKLIAKQIHNYYLKHKIEFNKYHKEYYQKHKEEIRQYKKDWQKNLTKEQRKNKVQKQCNRLKININFRISGNLRNRIYYAIKNNTKFKPTLKLLDCSIEFLKKYLQKQFTLGMNWKNYGKWHIDHIRPCASFDLSKPTEQKKCFHYTNLQPLWAMDNLSKGDNL